MATPVVDLDQARELQRADPGGMAALIAGFAAQAREAWALGCAWPLPPELRTPRRVVVSGVGGSAIGADLVAALAAQTSTVPVQVIRGYTAPPADEDTLLVAASFSGDTRETLDAFGAQLDGPGMRLVITSGGRLQRLAESRGSPLLRYDFAGPPRSGLGYGVFLLLAVLSRLGVLDVDERDLEATFARLEERAEAWRPAVPTADNPAKQLALRVHGTTAIVVGTGLLEAAARRWAGQLNENAKQWAIHTALPEADHNLIVGFAHPEVGGRPHALLLDALALDRRDRMHVGLTELALNDGAATYDTVLIEAESALGALLEACHLGDWVSLYVAALNGVDPMAIDALGTFKQRLSELWEA